MYGLDDVVTSHPRELGPDVADVAVDCAVGDIDLRPIGRGHDLVAAEYDPSARKKDFENRKLDGGQVERMAVEFGGMLHRPKRQGAMRQGPFVVYWRYCSCSRAAQDDVDPRDDLARAERFRHIIVAADLKADDSVDLVIARREKQDWYVG